MQFCCFSVLSREYCIIKSRIIQYFFLIFNVISFASAIIQLIYSNDWGLGKMGNIINNIINNPIKLTLLILFFACLLLLIVTLVF